MSTLRYLNLSNAGFSGLLPPQLGNLTNLIHLDLNYALTDLMPQESLEWASGLSKLQSLDLSFLNMAQEYDILQVLSRLPSLLALSLSGCSLHNTHLSELLITNISNTNSSTLRHLDLSGNNFEGPIPSFIEKFGSLHYLSLRSSGFSGSVPLWLINMWRLEYLDLSFNNINGSLPSLLGQLTNLTYLDLSHNEFQGRVPAFLAKLSALNYLDLSKNKLSGLIPDVLGHLTEIDHLDISSNSIQGTISGLSNLSKLSYLDMNYNNLNLNLSIDWRPPFQLTVFHAQSCEINTVFPQWLRNQTQIISLDLSNTDISGELPQWLWNLTNNLNSLQLAGNQLTGSLPPHIACDKCNLVSLDLHSNQLSGTIPSWVEHLETAIIVDLSENLLSGVIFEGKNASSLLNGQNLVLVDLSDNKLYGEIKIKNVYPGASLEILSLGGNDFSGVISSQLCLFQYLAILELAHNRLTGHIPRCLGSLTFDTEQSWISSDFGLEIEEIIKGITEKFFGTKGVHSMIDVSSNRLIGTIPEELTNISKLRELNLSNNHLTGGIPGDIGNLQLLESLDLSNNHLSGTIPQSLSAIRWLSFLNLSNNNLHGPIPTGSQLQTLDNPSIYAGNPDLCGIPLPNKCAKLNPPPSPADDDQGAEEDDVEDTHETMWFYLVIMSGVATGFWVVVGTLVFKKSWRHSYFRFVEETADIIYVPLKVRVNRFRNRLR